MERTTNPETGFPDAPPPLTQGAHRMLSGMSDDELVGRLATLQTHGVEDAWSQALRAEFDVRAARRAADPVGYDLDIVDDALAAYVARYRGNRQAMVRLQVALEYAAEVPYSVLPVREVRPASPPPSPLPDGDPLATNAATPSAGGVNRSPQAASTANAGKEAQPCADPESDKGPRDGTTRETCIAPGGDSTDTAAGTA